MTPPTPAPDDVLERVDALGPPGTPVTTPEVAEGFDCTRGTIHDRLDALVEDGTLRTKRVGANSRVWWRAADGTLRGNDGDPDRQHSVPIRDERSASASSVGEITEQRVEREHEADRERLMSELVESETRFRNVFKNDMVPMAVWTDDGRIRDANEAFLDLLGYTREELDAGEIDWTDRTPPEYDQRDEEALAEVEETGSCDPYEKEFVHKDGHRIPVVIGGGEFDTRRDHGILFAVDITEREEAERQLRRSEQRTHAQKEAFQAAIDGAPLDESLGTLARTVEEEMAGEVRTAFYTADQDCTSLHPITDGGSMPESYTEQVDGFVVGTDSLACGLATATGSPVVTPDVFEAPEWEPWLHLASEYDFRGCWSFPIETRDGEPVGTFALYFREPREPSRQERALADTTTQAAAIIISRHTEARKRARAEAELRESEAALERLNAATRELIDTDTASIADGVAPLVREVLDVEYASLWSYDEETADLEKFASHTVEGIDAETVGFPDDLSERIWQTYIGDELHVEFDVPKTEHEPAVPTPGSVVLVPLGRHGVVCLASTRTDAFDERTLELVETVAATVETAWTRAEGEQELVQQNEELARLDRLYTLMWQIDQALIQADTVEAIDEVICERLAASDLYEFAWIGDYDVTTDVVEPRAWAGVDGSYLDDLGTAIGESVTSESPFASAVRSGERRVVTDVASDTRANSWREITLQQGARSCLSLPIAYDGSAYGVLVVYGGSPLHDERDADTLAELGRTTAHAIHAVERRDALRTDRVVELALRSEAAETPLCRLSAETGCAIDLEGVVPGSDGSTAMFFTATGVAPDELVAAGERSVVVDELVCLTEWDEEALFRVRLADPSLASRLLDREVSVQSLTIESGTATAVVDLPESAGAGVREFIETLREFAPDLELLSRGTRTRTFETGLALRTAFEDRLTPRQREILQFAYRSGYFESPRLNTGRELSEALGLSQSTFNTHLRGAERRLFEVVFDRSREDS